MKWEPVIGLEVHAQLKTKTKIFCGCPTEFGKGPNEQVCPICLGMPGVLPVLNKQAVQFAIRTGLALRSHIAEECRFDRKNYFYPDLPKGYQISQMDKPICVGGQVKVGDKTIRLQRAHLEEDAGKLVHTGAAGLHGSDYSLVDFNRSGTPLLEIVSEPDITSPEEARLYLTELRNILRYIEVCDGNLEEGSFRCDANVSIRPAGETKLGTRAEIKNMNSFKAVEKAIQSEIDRQTALLESGQRVKQETRLWNENDGKTHTMRSKEDSHDYRYFPEPDLMPLLISRQWVDDVAKALPELPEQRRSRYTVDHSLSTDDAVIIAESKDMADFFDQVLQLGFGPNSKSGAKTAANYLIGPTNYYLKENKLELSETKLTPRHIRDLCQVVESGKLGSTKAKELLTELLASGGDVETIIESKGLAQVSDVSAIEESVKTVLSANESQLNDYKSGKTKVRQFFFGAVMKANGGKANPQVVNKLLDELLPPVESTN